MSDLCISPDPELEYCWRLVKPLVYRGHTDTWLVPAGFVTDFASVPRLLWAILPPYGKHTRAAIIHDYLYSTQELSRSDADGVFRRIMRQCGVGWFRRWTMWAGVRLGGWMVWGDRARHNRRHR